MSRTIGISGSRSILDRSEFEQALAESPWGRAVQPYGYECEFVTGDADGVDTSAKLFAEENNIPIDIIEPDYSDWSGDEHPAKRRNTEIVKKADVLVAVWDGNSNGTRDTIDKALDRGVPVYVKIVD